MNLETKIILNYCFYAIWDLIPKPRKKDSEEIIETKNLVQESQQKKL